MNWLSSKRRAALRHTPDQAARRRNRLVTVWSNLAFRVEHEDDPKARRRLIQRLWWATLALRDYEVARAEAIYRPRFDSRAQWELEASR